MAPEGLSGLVGTEKTFGYAFLRRWAFLLLALVNIPIVYLALSDRLLDRSHEWIIFILCANIILGPLAIQAVRLSRNMQITVTDGSICGRNFFGRQVELRWADVRKVVRILLPLRGATIVVFPRSGGERITFAESIEGLDELLGLIRQRAAGCEMKV